MIISSEKYATPSIVYDIYVSDCERRSQYIIMLYFSVHLQVLVQSADLRIILQIQENLFYHIVKPTLLTPLHRHSSEGCLPPGQSADRSKCMVLQLRYYNSGNGAVNGVSVWQPRSSSKRKHPRNNSENSNYPCLWKETACVVTNHALHFVKPSRIPGTI